MEKIRNVFNWYTRPTLARDFLSASILAGAMLAAAAVLVR